MSQQEKGKEETFQSSNDQWPSGHTSTQSDDIEHQTIPLEDPQEKITELDLDKETVRTTKTRDTEPNTLVTIEPWEPQHPLAWSTRKKITHTVAYGLTTFTAQFSASVISPAEHQLAEQFSVGREVGVLCFIMFIAGNILGPMIFGPLSEVYGRKPSVFIPNFISGILMIVCANVSSIWALLVFRFVAGIFAAAPIVSSGGAMADLWDPTQRGAAIILYALCITTASSAAPIFGALCIDSGSYGWRWACWLGSFLQIIVSGLNMLFLSESYRPVIEARQVRHMRQSTGKWGLHCIHDEWALTPQEFFQIHLRRPILMFLTPILALMMSYGSFVYGLLFLLIETTGEQFQSYHGFYFTTSFVPLICTAIGFFFGGMINIWNSSRYAEISRRIGGRPNPEERLIPMMYFSWALPGGCFMYGWTIWAQSHWIGTCFGLFLVGFSLCICFQGALVYMVDCYTKYAASAIAGYTVMRSVYGAVFPLFASQMFSAMGPHWASSLLGFVGIALMPIPWIFYFFGPRIRMHDPFRKELT